MTERAHPAKSIEQHCRDLLEIAIQEGLVAPIESEVYADPDPQSRTDAELAGMANHLFQLLQQNPDYD